MIIIPSDIRQLKLRKERCLNFRQMSAVAETDIVAIHETSNCFLLHWTFTAKRAFLCREKLSLILVFNRQAQTLAGGTRGNKGAKRITPRFAINYLHELSSH